MCAAASARLAGCIGLLACLAGSGSSEAVLESESESQTVDAKLLRSMPAQAGSDEVRNSRAVLLAQKHSWEVLSSQLLKADVSILLIAALWGVVRVCLDSLSVDLGFLRRI